MSKTKFKAGDRVGLNLANERQDEYAWQDPKKIRLYFDIHSEGPSYGQITSLDKNQAMVEWDNWCIIKNDELVDVKHLMSEEGMKKHYVQLEKDFETLEETLAVKVKEASKIIKEAGKLANKQGQRLADMYDTIGPLYDAMDSAGWRTSSFGC